jgi:hypothetical protein
MAVVFSHIGRPRNTTTAQKETMDRRRSHKLSFVSGGGCLGNFAAAVGVEDDGGVVSVNAPAGDAPVSFGDAMLPWSCSLLSLGAMSR